MIDGPEFVSCDLDLWAHALHSPMTQSDSKEAESGLDVGPVLRINCAPKPPMSLANTSRALLAAALRSERGWSSFEKHCHRS